MSRKESKTETDKPMVIDDDSAYVELFGESSSSPGTASDYLVVEDPEKPSSWHLRVKVGGKVNHILMGAAWAALHDGYRGNKYAGPQKEEAIKKLEALYADEKMSPPGKSKMSDEPSPQAQELSQFKSQLIQALDLNDQLITQLEKKDKEVSVFKEMNDSLQSVVSQKDTEISRLKDELQSFKMARFNEKKDAIYAKWLSRFNLSPEQSDSVQRMLSKFTSEDELADVERMLETSSGKKESTPVAITQTSAFLDNQTVEPSVSYDALSPEEKLNYLHSKLEKVTAIKHR